MQIAMAISRRRISFFVYTLCMCCVHLRATQRQLHGIIYRLHRPKVRLMYSLDNPGRALPWFASDRVACAAWDSWAVLGGRCSPPGQRRLRAAAQRLHGSWAGRGGACVWGGCTAARARWRGQRAGACVGREGHGGGGGGGEWGVSSLLKYLCRQGCVGSLLPALPPNEIVLHQAPGA